MMVNMNDFITSLTAPTAHYDLIFVDHWQQQIPIYDGDTLRQLTPQQMLDVQQEWAHIWQHDAGVVLVKNCA